MSEEYHVIYVDALGGEHREGSPYAARHLAVKYCEDPSHWPAHFIVRRVRTEDVWSTDEGDLEGGGEHEPAAHG